MGDLVFRDTLDTKMITLDAKTRKVIWSTQIAHPELGHSETMAPVAVNGRILIGTNGGEYVIRGFVKAYAANDGKLLWTLDAVPDKGQEGVWAVNDATDRNMLRDIAGEKAQPAAKGGDIYRTPGWVSGWPRQWTWRATPRSSSSATPAPTSTAKSARATRFKPTRSLRWI